jgi:hypothetical protein
MLIMTLPDGQMGVRAARQASRPQSTVIRLVSYAFVACKLTGQTYRDPPVRLNFHLDDRP